MATRSFIGKVQNDGTVVGVYCHWDGYPDCVGKTLAEHYKDPAKVDALIALGSISSLGEEIGSDDGVHTFDNPRDGWTVAYGRDRGEELEPPIVYASIHEAGDKAPSDLGAEYVYTMLPDRQWFVKKA